MPRCRVGLGQGSAQPGGGWLPGALVQAGESEGDGSLAGQLGSLGT